VWALDGEGEELPARRRTWGRGEIEALDGGDGITVEGFGEDLGMHECELVAIVDEHEDARGGGVVVDVEREID
jgi:hypothetical protein